MKEFLKYLLPVVLFITVAALGLYYLSYQTRLHSTVLNSTECAPPCWHGIAPGKTSVDEANNILLNQAWIDLDTLTIEQNQKGITQIYWRFKRPAGDTDGFIYAPETTISAITILSVGSLNVTDALKLLGTPKNIISHVNNGYIDLLIYSSDEGWLFQVSQEIQREQGNLIIDLKETTPVMRVSYFDPPQFQKMFTRIYLLSGWTDAEIGSVQPWPGLGTISTIKEQ